MIKGYKIPVIAIIGAFHTHRVGEKLKERDVKVEVINLKPIEDDKMLVLRWWLYTSSILTLLWLNELLSLHKELYGNTTL